MIGRDSRAVYAQVSRQFYSLLWPWSMRRCVRAAPIDHTFVVAQQTPADAAKTTTKDDDSLEAKYNRRFPQPTKVGHLIGLPVLDDNDVTLGYVQKVVRTPEGKIELIVSYSKWFGWFGRPVAVPIEAVAILALQLDSVEMQPEDYAEAPTWIAGQRSDSCRQRHRARRARTALITWGDRFSSPGLFFGQSVIGAVGEGIVAPRTVLRCQHNSAALKARRHVAHVVGTTMALEHALELLVDLRRARSCGNDE